MTPSDFLADMTALRSSDAKRQFKQAILERDHHQCRYCGSTDDLTLDHVVPRSRGGRYESSNLVTACRSCNQDKASLDLWTWLTASASQSIALF